MKVIQSLTQMTLERPDYKSGDITAKLFQNKSCKRFLREMKIFACLLEGLQNFFEIVTACYNNI